MLRLYKCGPAAAKRPACALWAASSSLSSLPLPTSRLTGINASKQRLPALEQLLTDTRSTLEQVMDFMLGKL